MIPYASRTGTKRNLAALRAADRRLLVSARGVLRTEGFPYALDNGAWSAFTHGEPFDERAFGIALRKLGRDADWTVIPDIVAGGIPSLEFSLRWMRQVLDECRLGLLAVQDGMTPSDVEHLVGARVGIFVGGSTEWKESTVATWAARARTRSMVPRWARQHEETDQPVRLRARHELRRVERVAVREDAPPGGWSSATDGARF